MHSLYSVVKELRGCFKGKFWCSIVLFLKSLVHLYEMWQIESLITQIFLYPRICIAGTFLIYYIRLSDDIETKPGPAVVDNIDSCKTILRSLLKVQIYLAVLVMANSFRKLCVTAKENHVA